MKRRETQRKEMPLEAVRMTLTGDMEQQFDLYYKVLQSGGWTEWAKNGETAGTEGQGLRIDGFQAAVTRKGAKPPADSRRGRSQPSHGCPDV